MFIASVILIVQTIRSGRDRKSDTPSPPSKAGSGKPTAPCSSRRSSDSSPGPFATSGIASLAQNLLGAFPGISNPENLNEYVNSYRRNPNAGDLLSQLLMGSRRESFYNNYNLPRYCDSQRGPVIVQLPSSPPLSGVPKYHDRTMFAIEGPETHTNIAEVGDSPQSSKQFSRCQSDGDLRVKGFDDKGSLKLLRRDTYRY